MIVVKPEWVYAATVFFLPFSATAVINLGSDSSSASGVQVWLYLATLLLLRWAVISLFRLEIQINNTIRRLSLYLSVFVAICAISLLMPLWINGHLQVMSPYLLDFTTTPLVFTSKNITGFLYILIGFCFALFVANKNADPHNFRRSSYLFLLSCVFVAAWGLFQLSLNVLHLPYPAMIFNNSATPSAAGYTETLAMSEITRLTSVAVEPSMLVQTLLLGLTFTLPALLGNGYILGLQKDRIAATMLIFTCLAATSSTGYIGLTLLLLLVCWIMYKSGRLRARIVIGLVCGAIAVIGAYFTVSVFHTIATNTLLNKGTSFSALERAKTIYYAFQYFLDYPVLGVGWASVTSHDLVVKILSNTGIVGFTAFSVFVGLLLANMLRTSRRAVIAKRYFDQPSTILFIACVEMLLLASITEFPDVFGHFWFILGMGIASTSERLNDVVFFVRKAA